MDTRRAALQGELTVPHNEVHTRVLCRSRFLSWVLPAATIVPQRTSKALRSFANCDPGGTSFPNYNKQQPRSPRSRVELSMWGDSVQCATSFFLGLGRSCSLTSVVSPGDQLLEWTYLWTDPQSGEFVGTLTGTIVAMLVLPSLLPQQSLR